MKLNQKDKSLLLFIITTLVVLWGVFSFLSGIFFSATFGISDAKKIVNDKNKEWFNVSRPLETSDLKDRVILLHFWTYSCVSCIESLAEIKKLEEEFGDKLTVIGVHSAKFDNDKDHVAIKKAVLKYDISHPVVSDPQLKIWGNFKVQAWPTFILLNTHGNEVERFVGANQVKKMLRETKKLLSKYKYEISRDPLPIVLERYNTIGNILNFPTKLEYASNFTYKSRQLSGIFTSNTGDNNILLVTLAGDIAIKIGSTKEGFQDGSFDVASFRTPRGLLFDGANLYVADSGNHAIRIINFKEGKVETLIGSGVMGEVIDGEFIDAKKVNLASPNDLEFFPDRNHIAISNSGTNQILVYDLKNQTISVLAGDGSEGMEDGKYPQNSLAQTSDMSAFGRKLYFVDALSSSLRVIDENGNVKTLIGNPKKFGHENGDKNKALMQHPLGLNVDDTGVYISDSFNHTIRKYDLVSGQIRDLVGAARGDEIGNKTRFDEPEGIITILDRFYVADSGNNRIVMVNRGSLTSELLDVMPPLKLPKEGFLQYLPNLQKTDEIKIKSDAEILLKIDVKQGWKINEDGPSFINLLELVDSKQANLAASFDWHAVKSKEVKLSKLSDDKDYLLQGTIYYCEDKKNALCYVKSYEQKIVADDDEKTAEIVIKIGE